MVARPAIKPVTTPSVEPTDAIMPEVLQVPPGVASASVVVLPAHTVAVPVIASASGLTVMGKVTVQPLPNE